MKYESILDRVGNTPLIDISVLSPNPNVEIWAKLEGENPTGSSKDRIAKYMIRHAESEGLLRPGQTIIEPSSGNTGIAISLIGTLRGYPVKVVMPEAVSIERIQLLEAFGAEIIFSPGDLGSNGAVKLATDLAQKNPEWFMPFQYENENNPKAHYETTGQEIIDDLPDINMFVSGLGTGGTLTGVGRRLKEFNPDIKVIAAAPHPGDLVQGLRALEDGYIPPVFDETLLDGRIVVDSETSFRTTRELTRQTGIFAGISAGAVIRAAQRAAEKIEIDSTKNGTSTKIVCLLADGGWKYLSTGLWSEDYENIREAVSEKLWW
ncbi:MAG TPA: cysteine synthase family protein [Dehalococcoidia bacterium]|jgi:cysteine synthase B|nr:cysteine synthase family protein [Dehalococcoidia bacterium]